jgi:hypothetical protein
MWKGLVSKCADSNRMQDILGVQQGFARDRDCELFMFGSVYQA